MLSISCIQESPLGKYGWGHAFTRQVLFYVVYIFANEDSIKSNKRCTVHANTTIVASVYRTPLYMVEVAPGRCSAYIQCTSLQHKATEPYSLQSYCWSGNCCTLFLNHILTSHYMTLNLCQEELLAKVCMHGWTRALLILPQWDVINNTCCNIWYSELLLSRLSEPLRLLPLVWFSWVWNVS